MIDWIFLTILLLVIMVSVYMFWLARQNRLVNEEKSFSNLPYECSGMRFLFISDIHKRIIHEPLLQQIKEIDAVFVGGDLLEKGVPLSRARDNIRKLKKTGKTYFVFGNHDYDMDVNKLTLMLKEEQVVILQNNGVTLEKNGKKIGVFGVDDYTAGYPDLKKALQDEAADFRILLSHNPDFKSSIIEEDRISLMLSGHTHGGQIRIGPFGLAQKGGWYRFGKTQLLISNGYGVTRLPFRLGAPPEVHLITIKSE